MGPIQTARCQTCQAIVNPSWEMCAACHCPLTSHEIVIEPGHPNAHLVYFERADGVIYGPATVLDLANASAGGPQREWVIIAYQGLWEWVVSDRLRSKEAFERQVTPSPFTRITEPR
jgi:hypothetical protein